MDAEVVTRLRAVATTTDPYSQTPVADWTVAPVEHRMQTLAPPEPRPSSEPVQDARNAVTTGWTIYLPAGADVTARDRMRVRGEVYDVLGDPAAWADAGVIVQLEKTRG